MKINYGVTPPISTAEPTANEIKLTEDLVSVMVEAGQYESKEEGDLRLSVLFILDDLFKKFVTAVSIKNNLPVQIAQEAGGKVFAFGSFRLGVHGKGSDIDTLCVGPKHVKREDFFTDFYEILKARPEVSEIAGVPDAYVPVIKLVFSSIAIDLVYARLSLPSVDNDLSLLNNNLLKNLDERCVRSLNGSRVTDEMLSLVPNISAFRVVLRCIKLWAKRRAIYANVFGFFGGVAWAIVVARVCQLYPNAAASTIVSKFFRLLHGWDWPMPVLLKPIEDANLGMRIWNPKLYNMDKTHRMPVITPAYPSMCSTHNITKSTQIVKLQEFERAADIMDKVMCGTTQWSELFEKHDFFSRYRNYLQVVASSDNSEDQLLWSGMVESRLRQLVMKLESINEIEIAHPFIKGYDQSTACDSEIEAENARHSHFLGDLNYNPNISVAEVDSNDLEKEPEVYPKQIYTTCLYIGLSVLKTGARQLDVNRPITEFIYIVKAWDKFSAEKMDVRINFVKRNNLPKHVFEGAEEGSISKKKKVKKRKDVVDKDASVIATAPKPMEDEISETKRVKFLPREEEQMDSSLVCNTETDVVEKDRVNSDEGKPTIASSIPRMFTGIVETLGLVVAVVEMDTTESGGSGFSITILSPEILQDCNLGDSISVNGTCLTVTEFDDERTWFKVGISSETIRKTCLSDLKPNDHVNLERAMGALSRYGGHIVQGHIDCTVEIISIVPDPPNSLIFTFKVPVPVGNDNNLIVYVVPKGYVCLDGISLTVIDVDTLNRTFSIMMIAYTQEKVTLSRKKIGDRVNLEVDPMAKYVESVLKGMLTGSSQVKGIFESMIKQVLHEST